MTKRNKTAVSVTQCGNETDVDIVRKTLRDICQDGQAPPAARAAAARTLYEIATGGGKKSVGRGKPPSEMSFDEMEAELSAERGTEEPYPFD